MTTTPTAICSPITAMLLGLAAFMGNALHALGVWVHIHEGVAVDIDDDQVAAAIGRSPAIGAVEALAAQVEPIANADDLRDFGQAVRVGESAQINLA